MDCIVDNIINDDLKTTFNALLSTNSMRRNTVLTPIRNNARQLLTDRGLKTFVAFEYYYAVLMDIELSQLTSTLEPFKAKPAIEFNEKPLKDVQYVPKKIDNHEGHNHD